MNVTESSFSIFYDNKLTLLWKNKLCSWAHFKSSYHQVMQIIEIIFVVFICTVYKIRFTDYIYRDSNDRIIRVTTDIKTLGFPSYRHHHHHQRCHPHHLCHLHPLHGDAILADWPVAGDALPIPLPWGQHGPLDMGPVWKISSASDKTGNTESPVNIHKCGALGNMEINMEGLWNSAVPLQPCPPEHGPFVASQGLSRAGWANCAALFPL